MSLGNAFDLLSRTDTLDRLDGALPPTMKGVFEYISEAAESILWVKKPWADISFEELVIDQDVDVAVFEERVDVDGLLLADTESLLGHFPYPNSFLFLSEVTCHDLIVPPDAKTLFAGGMKVERLASVASPGATSFVSKSCSIAALFSGMGDAWLSLDSCPEVNIGDYFQYVKSYDNDDLGEAMPSRDAIIEKIFGDVVLNEDEMTFELALRLVQGERGE